MRTRIISAFPGTGKSYFHNNTKYSTLDSDSSEFSWITNGDGDKIRNPDFPANYISHIRDNIGKVDFICVSSHKEVRDAMKDACIFFYLMYPETGDKEVYIERYKDRGSPQGFIDLISKNWDNWIQECRFEEFGCENISMSPEWTVTREVRHIIAKENGDE